MPSPIGHAIAGYIIYRVTATSPVGQRVRRIGLYVLAANAADFDFIPGFLIGDPDRYHHGVSHSIGFAILFAAVVGLQLFLRHIEGVRKQSAIFFALYCSHILLDWLSIDNSFPYGVPFFWPFSDAYSMAPIAFLLDIRRHSSASRMAFVVSLFSSHNLRAVGIELLVLFPFTLLVIALGGRRKGAAESSPRQPHPAARRCSEPPTRL